MRIAYNIPHANSSHIYIFEYAAPLLSGPPSAASTSSTRQEKPGSKWIQCKYCLNPSAQSTTIMSQHLDSVLGITISMAPDFSVRTTATETIEALYTKLLLRLVDSKDDLE